MTTRSWNPAHSGGPESNRRRSQRVMLRMPVTVHTEGSVRSAPFEEATHTLIVNAHGALIALAGEVEKGEVLRLTNPATRKEQACKVTYVGPSAGIATQIGIEFKEPSSDFWNISFPPEDWVNCEREAVAPKEQK